MLSEDYFEVIPKPWGFEYEVIRNKHVRLLHLKISAGMRTSMHCHLQKKTSMLVLSGSGSVSFLSSEVHVAQGSKFIFRPGLFHRIEAGENGLECIEIENPPLPNDLFRLSDTYGREDMGYEDSEKRNRPFLQWDLRPLSEAGDRDLDFETDNAVCSVVTVSTDADIRSVLETADQLVVLSGGMVSPNGFSLLGPSDVVEPRSVKALQARLRFLRPTRLFCIEFRATTGLK